MEYIDILDVLTKCSEFLSEPENEEKVKAFDDMKTSLIILPYLPLERKEIIFEKTIKDIKLMEKKVYIYTSMVELSLTFNALLAYTNIDSDIIEAAKDYAFYDVLWASGLCDYILQYCEKDYSRLCNMVYHMLSYENLFVLIDELKDVDTKSIEELTAEFKKFKFETDPEFIKNLGNIAIESDPIMKSLKDTVDQAAVDFARKADSES